MHSYNTVINDASTLFCDFEDTGMIYKTKKVYSCKHCNIKLTLDNPSTKVFCFAKRRALDEAVNPQAIKPIDNIKDPNQIVEIAKQQILEKGVITENTFDISEYNTNDNMCSKEQISERMAICQKCEYFKDNSCLLCGCTVVREQNYNNKLAKKNQHCPIFKWKQIKD